MNIWIIMILVMVVSLLVQGMLQSRFEKYSKVGLPNGMTGAEVAEKMLRDHGIYDVKVVPTRGMLTDHFNPQTKTVALSEGVYASRSVAAAAVAAHECGHAVQHAQGYAPLRMRSALVPLVNFSSQAASWLIIIGLIMTASSGSQLMCWIGVGLMCVSALFSFITLPVEYNASSRALDWLRSTRTLDDSQMEGATISLRWAARTYLVAALSAIATLLYYLGFARNRD